MSCTKPEAWWQDSANHIGSFRDKMYQLCKSLYFGGVTRRFPTLNLAFLECGVAWACIPSGL